MPDSVLLDTNIVSYIFRRAPLADVYWPHLQGKLLVVSFVTVGELDYWAIRNNWGEPRRAALEQSIRDFVIHPYTRELSSEWARIRAATEHAGRPISAQDAWIAATATLHGIPLVTHDARDFAAVPGLQLVTEYRPAEPT